MEDSTAAKAESDQASQPGPRRRGPKPADPATTKSASVNIRVNPSWKEWADGLADFLRARSFGDLVDRALVDLARQEGYDKPAPKR